MKFLLASIASAIVLAVSTVEASSLRGPAPERELVEYYEDYDYKKISVQWTGQGTKCWDAKQYSSYIIPYATSCTNYDGQYWTYTKGGQIYNKYYQKCLAYDYAKQYGYNWVDGAGQSYPVYIYLDNCDDVSSWQKFLFVNDHWVSAHDGTCVDLVRDYGGYFETQTCQACWSDQEFEVEGTWFSYFDESQC